MVIIISTLAILVLLAILLYQRRGPPASSERPRPATQSAKVAETSEFHAVSIHCTRHACEAAKNLVDRRYLSSAAPRLPLDDCDAAECKCRFVHHKDRRSSEPRRNPWSPGISGETGRHPQERRHEPDRRANDTTDDLFK